MRLLMLFGQQAVGKMTVGQALTRITPLRLFHNHMTIEPVLSLFGDFNVAAVMGMRELLFREFLKTEHYGMIFTFQWAFDVQADWDYVRSVTELFEAAGAQVDYCELVAPLPVRLARNQTPNRLQEKPSKRNLARSEEFLRRAETEYRDVSLPGELPFERYLRIENAELPPEEAAQRIKAFFGYPDR